MPKAIPNLDKYKHFCDQLKNRRLNLGISQTKIALTAEYSNTNIICILENKYAAIPLAKAPLLAKAYNLDVAEFCKAVAYTRHPDDWGLLFHIMNGDPNISCGSREEIEQGIEAFIESINTLSTNATK